MVSAWGVLLVARWFLRWGSQVGSHIPLARVSIGIGCRAGFGLCADGGDWRGVRGDWGARTRAAGAKWGAEMAARGTFGLAGHLVGAEGLRCGLSHRKVEACARALGGCARSWCGKVMVAVRSVRAWPRGGPGASRSRVAAALVRGAWRIKYVAGYCCPTRRAHARPTHPTTLRSVLIEVVPSESCEDFLSVSD